MNKTVFVAQIFITFFMALTMSGTLTLINMGFINGFFATWLRMFLTAWPIAFIYTQFVSPLAFFLAGKVTGGKAAH